MIIPPPDHPVNMAVHPRGKGSSGRPPVHNHCVTVSGARIGDRLRTGINRPFRRVRVFAHGNRGRHVIDRQREGLRRAAVVELSLKVIVGRWEARLGPSFVLTSAQLPLEPPGIYTMVPTEAVINRIAIGVLNVPAVGGLAPFVPPSRWAVERGGAGRNSPQVHLLPGAWWVCKSRAGTLGRPGRHGIRDRAAHRA